LAGVGQLDLSLFLLLGSVLHVETCNPVCTDLLISTDHKPKTRLVWPNYWVYRPSCLYSRASAHGLLRR